MNYTNTNNYSNSQLQKADSFEDYYYNNNNNKEKNNLYNGYPSNHVNGNNKSGSQIDIYHSSYVNNNSPNTSNNLRKNNSNTDRYNSTLPPVNSTYPSYKNDNSFPNNINNRDQPIPTSKSLIATDKNEFKNIYVKVKSKRPPERFNNMVDYSIYEPSNLKYSREEIEQLKKELNIEFNGIDTLEEFKKLNQNEQKKLIIQICRFLMRRAGIKSENSIPWKQLAMNNASFTFINWPLTLPSKSIEPGYPTHYEAYYEEVPYEDLSRLKTSHRKTLFMALRSGAVYAVKLNKKKNGVKANNINGNVNSNINNKPNSNSLIANSVPVRNNNYFVDEYKKTEKDIENIEKRRNEISLEKQHSPSFIPVNERFREDDMDRSKGPRNDPNYPYRYSDKPNSYDYKDPIIEKEYFYQEKKFNEYEKKYNSNNDYPYNNKRNYYSDYNPDYLKYPSIDKKEPDNFWKYRSKDDNYNRKDDDYWKYRSNNDYTYHRYSSKPSDIPDFNSDTYNSVKSSPKTMENNDNYRRSYSADSYNNSNNNPNNSNRNYYKGTPSSLSPSQPPNKKRLFGSRYPEDYDEYGLMNNPNKNMKLSTNKPDNPYSTANHQSNAYNTSSPISNYNKSANGSLNNTDSTTKNSNDFSRIKNDTFSNSNSFYDSPYSSNGSSQNKPNSHFLNHNYNNNIGEINHNNNANINNDNIKPIQNRNIKDRYPDFDQRYFNKSGSNYNDSSNNDKFSNSNNKMNSPFSSNRLPPPIQDSHYSVNNPFEKNYRQDRTDGREKNDGYLYNSDHGKPYSNRYSYQLPSLDDLSSDNSKKENNGQVNVEKRSPYDKMKISNLLFDVPSNPPSSAAILSNINTC